MQVSLLQLNAGISHAVETRRDARAQNARACAPTLAKLERRRAHPAAAASKLGIVLPQPAGALPASNPTARRPSPPRKRDHRAEHDASRRTRSRPSRRPSRPPPIATAPRRRPRTSLVDLRTAARPRVAGASCRARIGLLFAVFLCCSRSAAGRPPGSARQGRPLRAARHAAGRGHHRPRAPRHDHRPHGIELAVSERRSPSRHPYLIKDPAARGPPLAPLLAPARGRRAAQARPAQHRLRLPRAASSRPSQAQQIAQAAASRARVHPASRAHLPADWMASQLLGASAPTTTASPASSTRSTRPCAAPTASGAWSRTRSASRSSSRHDARPQPGHNLDADARRGHPGQAEEVLARSAQKWQPKGATAIVMDPRTGAILALANWPRVNANDLGDAPDYARQNRAIGSTYEPGSTFKASPSPARWRTARSRRTRRSTSRRRSRSPTARSTTPRTAATRR